MPEVIQSVEDVDLMTLFPKAMAFMEEGEYEDACEIFEKLVKHSPQDNGIWWQYLKGLQRARMSKEADACVNECIARFPNDLGFIFEWTRARDACADWEEALRRRRFMLEQHSPFDNLSFLLLVTESFLPLIETKNFTSLRELLETYWELFFQDENCGGSVYYALEAIADYPRQIELCRRFLQKSGAENPVIAGINYANLLVIAESALCAQKFLFPEGAQKINVLSLGQNCLPYTVGNRWGLIDYAGSAEVTVFDLGAFGKNTAADALMTDFSAYSDTESYYQGRDHAGAPQMFHRSSGVHFGHERGRAIIGDDQKKFHDLIEKKINYFRQKLSEGRCLLIYGIVGECDLPLFVNRLEPLLKEKNHRLLVVNFTRAFHNCPASPHVSYEHIPFPVDYNWNSTVDYTSDRGLAFDMRYTSAVRRELASMLRS